MLPRPRPPHRPPHPPGGSAPAAWRSLAVLLTLGAGGACGERPPGSTCLASTDCSTELCYANRCLDRASDDDEDGLSNGAEHRVHSHPLKVDTDGDGKPDGAEVGGDVSAPLDRDGDGKPDVLESALADRDRDCLPDELDAQDELPNQDPAVLARDVCSKAGVCLGQSAAIVATCDVGAGTLSCNYAKVPGWSEGEACDGKDNDCDGQTDEGHSYQGLALGAPCQGVGACGPGTVQCASGKAVCSSNPDGPTPRTAPELCNGLDDDCDGKTDEGFMLDGLHVGTPCYGAGECGVGTVRCGPTGHPQCSSNPGGADAQDKPEICDGKDNDCDGQTDEDIVLGLRPLGSVCMGLGACGPGVVVCGADGAPVCSSDAGAPGSKATAEVCNGLDDNCDGQTDEGFAFDGALLGQPCAGRGICPGGVVVCGQSGKATCSTLPDAPGVAPKAELCNGLDDDCDGQTDEDFVYQGQTLGQLCEGVGACGQGIVECNAAQKVTCSTHADGSTPQVQVETCNGVDDDCDGLVDESIASPPPPPCVPQGLCLGAQPKAVCLGGEWTCDYPGLAGFEGPVEATCDAKDNDCDGLTDEGLGKTWATAPKRVVPGRPAPRIGAAWGAGGGGLFLAGGLVGSLGGVPSPAPDLWRLDLAVGRWAELQTHPALARQGAALAWLPDKLAGAGARVWILGGYEGSGAATTAWSFEIDGGTAQELSWKAGPLPTAGATAIVDASNKRLWLLGGTLSGQFPGVQSLDLKAGKWLPSGQLPQLDAPKGPIAACLDPKGHLYAYGADAKGGPFLSRLDAAGSKWQALPAAPEGPALSGARLSCEAASGEIWLVGGASPGGGPAGLWRYHVATAKWQAPAGSGGPAVLRPAIAARPAGGLVITHGETADETPSDLAWEGTPAAFTPLWGGPSTALGAQLVTAGGDVWRVGGAVIAGKKLTPAAASWRLHGGQWSAYPRPASLPGRLFPTAAPDPAGGRLLLWGGVSAAGGLGALSSTVAQEAMAGGEALDLKTGAMSALPTADLAMVPELAAEALAAPGAAGELWVMGGAPKTSKTMLWRLDLLAKSKTLQWSQPSPGPAFRRGSVLWRDAGKGRLLLLSVDGALQLWAWDLGGKSWKKLAEDAAIAQGRVRLWGDAAIAPPLALVTFPLGGPPPALRRLGLGAKATLTPVPAKSPPRWGPVHATWQPGVQAALLSRGVDLKGVPAAGMERWPLQCP